MESFGRLRRPAMSFVRELARIASGDGAVDKRHFIEGALQELSVALCRGIGRLRCGLAEQWWPRCVIACSAQVQCSLQPRSAASADVVPRRLMSLQAR